MATIHADCRFAFRSDTAVNWQTNNPTLLKGEIGTVTDGSESEKMKIGDGVTPWNSLGWFKGPKGIQGIQGIQGPKGEKGEKGDTGATGPQGEKGDAGEQGIQGLQGLQGIPGYTPVKGTDYFTSEDIESLNIPVVDQDYNVYSSNAISCAALREVLLEYAHNGLEPGPGGFAAGANAWAGRGAAVGKNSFTTDGFAGGYNATTGTEKYTINAIQLGEGNNTEENSLQIYSYKLMHADGKIPNERLMLDQTYNPTSENAQSGEAVAVAIDNAIGSINAVLATILSGGFSTTSEYLAELITQQAQLAANLTALGIPADTTEPLDTLIAKTLQIPAGDSVELAAIKAILEKTVTIETEG